MFNDDNFVVEHDEFRHMLQPVVTTDCTYQFYGVDDLDHYYSFRFASDNYYYYIESTVVVYDEVTDITDSWHDTVSIDYEDYNYGHTNRPG